MFESDDPRLNQILDMIGRMAALEFHDHMQTSKKNDIVDAIIVGLNMLSEELQSNVVEKSKLHSVNDKLEKFALTAAHDLKSPINSITGIISLVEHSLATGNKKETDQYISILKSTTEKMKDLVLGILNYSRHSPTDVEVELLDINAAINHVVMMDRVDRFARLSIQQQLPLVRFNKSALIQVFRNIFSNAIKYNDKETCTISLTALDKNDHYQINITDNGPGIAPENHDKVFELFNSIDTSADVDSHGIGLASVKSILTSFNEKIWVESTLGNGATFCFTLGKLR